MVFLYEKGERKLRSVGKKFLTIVSLCILFLVTACSNSNVSGKEQSKVKEHSEKMSSGKTEIVFWHAMGGKTKEVLEQIVQKYNQSQDKVEVRALFQGTYDESFIKYKNIAGTKDAPDVIQVFDGGTKYMIDSGKIEPVQKFIDQDKYDVSQWEPNIRSYYTVDKKQYSMPFNSSTPVMVYNKDAFKEVGLDPDQAPKTFKEIEEAGKKLTKKEGNQVKRYGFTYLLDTWFFEEMLAVQGGTYVNNDNGRAKAATKATFNGKEGQRILEFVNNLNKEGINGNYGSDWDNTRAAFLAGKTAMYLDSSAGVKDIINSAPFQVGVAYLPYPEDVQREGVIIGGASLWMAKDIGKEKQKAVWEFMKYMTTPSIQAEWHVNTGYFAVNPKAYEEELVKKEYEKYPQLQVTVNQLHDSKVSPATQGALITVFPESRQKVQKAMESIIEGTDVKQALDQAAKETDRALEIENRAKK